MLIVISPAKTLDFESPVATRRHRQSVVIINPYMVSSPFARLERLMSGTGCCRISGLFVRGSLPSGLDEAPPPAVLIGMSAS